FNAARPASIDGVIDRKDCHSLARCRCIIPGASGLDDAHRHRRHHWRWTKKQSPRCAMAKSNGDSALLGSNPSGRRTCGRRGDASDAVVHLKLQNIMQELTLVGSQKNAAGDDPAALVWFSLCDSC